MLSDELMFAGLPEQSRACQCEPASQVTGHTQEHSSEDSSPQRIIQKIQTDLTLSWSESIPRLDEFVVE